MTLAIIINGKLDHNLNRNTRPQQEIRRRIHTTPNVNSEINFISIIWKCESKINKKAVIYFFDVTLMRIFSVGTGGEKHYPISCQVI